MNKKIVLTIFIMAIAMIVYVSGNISGQTPAYKGPPDTQKIEQVIYETPIPTEVPTLRLEENTEVIAAKSKISSDCYGGIGGSENNPPQGTVIDDSLTQYYGKTAATGNGETYVYISGWWFNLTQVAKLPSESLMYGMSPCAITLGSGESGTGGDDENIEPPISPVPEMSTIALVSAGLIGLFVLYIKKK